MLEYLKQFRSPQPKKRGIGITHSARAGSFFWSGLNHTVVLTVIAEGKITVATLPACIGRPTRVAAVQPASRFVRIATYQAIWDTLPLIQNDRADDDLVTRYLLARAVAPLFSPDSRDLKNHVG